MNTSKSEGLPQDNFLPYINFVNQEEDNKNICPVCQFSKLEDEQNTCEYCTCECGNAVREDGCKLCLDCLDSNVSQEETVCGHYGYDAIGYSYELEYKCTCPQCRLDFDIQD